LPVGDDPPWRVLVTARAEREMKQLSATDQARIQAALDAWAAGVWPRDTKKLEGKVNEWRVRIGGIRIRFARDLRARAVVVLHVLPRGRAYRD
jgi:mRNA-degrading endonuclease RelE of RelBE toxin-antitoxin system